MHVCICAGTHVGICMYMTVCMYVLGWLGLMLGLILNYSFTLSKVGDVSPLTPELTDTASLSSQLLWGSPTLSHKARIKGKQASTSTSIYVGSGGPNSAPHTCKTNTLFKKGDGEKAQC